MENFLRDLKYGLRVMRKRPVVTLAGVFCLALGIGAATVVFSLVSSVLLDPLPIEDSEEMVYIYTEFQRQGVLEGQVSNREFQELQDMTRAFEQVEALMPWFFNVTDGDQAERQVGGQVSAGLFPMLGVSPRLGRLFTQEEADQQAAVAIISHELWTRNYGADPNILGTTISLEDVPHDIVGIMPPDFFFKFEGASVWVPWRPNLQWPRHVRLVVAAARMAPGTSLEAAQNDLDSVAQRLQQEHTAAYPAESGWGLRAKSVREDLLGDVKAQLIVLMGAVLLVLFIACMNVANLLLVQAAKREREIGMRAALGAEPLDLVRQLLIESSILALLGCGLGLVVAEWGLRAVRSWNLEGIPRIANAGLDWRVLTVAVLVSLATGILFGMVPALRATKLDLYEVLREGARAGESGAKQTFRRVLVIGEITLAVVVLVGAGLMIKTFETFDSVDPGFNTENVVSSQLFLSPKRFPSGSERRALYYNILEALKGRAEVQQSAITSLLPLEPIDESGSVAVEGREATPGTPDPTASWRMISPDFFDVMDVPLLQGRTFTDLDHERNQAVVILDANLAKRLFPNESPLDRRILLERDPMRGADYRTIVGVVGTLRDKGLVGADNELLYVPYPQYAYTIMTVLAKTSLEPEQLGGVMRDVVRKIDPSQPVAEVQSTAQVLEASKSSARFNRFLFGIFGVVVLVLVGVGVYGIMAYSVAQRRQEIGLRMALGAEPGGVLAMVLRQGLKLGMFGLGVGLLLAAFLAVTMKSQLGRVVQGVQALDLGTFLSVFVVLTFLVLLGTFVPAFRATRIDPLKALREE